MQKLSEKDIRTLKLGTVGVGLILVFYLGMKWMDHWKEVRAEIVRVRSKLEAIDVGKARQAGLLTIVPVLEMPKPHEEQQFLFRDKLREQFKKAGINNKPLRFLSSGKTTVGGYKTLLVECSAKCRFDQVMNLLANLNENPYLVAVEEFQIRTDKKKPQEVELDLTVSTLVK